MAKTEIKWEFGVALKFRFSNPLDQGIMVRFYALHAPAKEWVELERTKPFDCGSCGD